MLPFASINTRNVPIEKIVKKNGMNCEKLFHTDFCHLHEAKI